MRFATVVLSTALLATAWLVFAAPSAEAMIYCVQKLKEPLPYDRCDGLVCLGYSQNRWRNCVPPPIYCLQSDCCGYPGLDFYCPEPR
ncbi:MAG: hypothetical protein ACT4PT_09010 [Methanobacteriota archaeon]